MKNFIAALVLGIIGMFFYEILGKEPIGIYFMVTAAIYATKDN